jgi:predicted nucleic acid-binding protein
VTLVIDASVAAKWVLPEAGSECALALRKETGDLIAPTFIAAEVANVAWKYARRGELSGADAITAVRMAIGAFARLIPFDELLQPAIEIAVRLRHPVYDCFYLVLADREGAILVTADDDQFQLARRARIKARRL